MSNLNNYFPDYYKDFIRSLNKHDVEYLLIGGYSMGVHGHIRATNDLDIFLNATSDNAKKAINAMVEYGIPKEQLTEEMFLVPRMMVLGDPPFKIDILKKLDTIDFKYAYQRVKNVVFDGLEVKVISIDDLILLKKAAVKGRDKIRDRQDLDFLMSPKEKKSSFKSVIDNIKQSLKKKGKGRSR